MFALLIIAAICQGPEKDGSAEKGLLGRIRVEKVLFLGNSITLHAPAPNIGWEGNWGMAASSMEKDFVHLLSAKIARESGTRPQTMVRNIADFERNHSTFDLAKEFQKELAFQLDLVILAIGENVPELSSEEAKNHYKTAFSRLLDLLKKSGRPTIVVRGCFWPNPVKDNIMKLSSAKSGAIFVDISQLGKDPANAASAERKFEHPGVGGHPGDKGMKAIADELFAAIKKEASSSVR